MFYKPPKYLIYSNEFNILLEQFISKKRKDYWFTFRPGTNMNHKWSLLGVGKFYTAEEALTLLGNMSDLEDESTSESEIEGDSSDSSEYAPEQQYQVRTNSNIQTLLMNETVNQNATKCALLADQTATTSGEEHVAWPPKVSKVKEISSKGLRAAPKLVVKKCKIPKGVSIA